MNQHPPNSLRMAETSWETAFRVVGLIPADVPISGGLRLRLGTRSENRALILDVPLVVPADKLRAALDMVEGRA